MAISCPGNDTFNKIYAVGRNGTTPLTAFLSAFLNLALDIGNDAQLGRFLSQDCAEGCTKVITGPTFSRFVSRLRQRAGGGWVCVIGGQLEAEIECVKVSLISDEECMRELAHYLAEAG